MSAPNRSSSPPVPSEPVARRCPVLLDGGARSEYWYGPDGVSRARAPPAFIMLTQVLIELQLWARIDEWIRVRLVGNQWVSPRPVPNDWSAWCRPPAHCPCAHPPSLDVNPPSGGRSGITSDEDDRSWSSWDTDFDGILYHYFSYPNNGRGLLPINAPLFNKFVDRVSSRGLWYSHPFLRGRVRLRNIKVGQPAVIRRLQMGTVPRAGGLTFIRDLEGRMTNTIG